MLQMRHYHSPSFVRTKNLMESLLLSNVGQITLLVCIMQMLLSPNRDHNSTVHNCRDVLVGHPIRLIAPHIGLNTFLHVIPRNIAFSHLLLSVHRQHVSHKSRPGKDPFIYTTIRIFYTAPTQKITKTYFGYKTIKAAYYDTESWRERENGVL